MLSLLGFCGARESAEFALDTQLRETVTDKIRESMASEIMRKLKAEGGVDADVVTKSAAEQGAFFFKFLQDIKDHGRQASMMNGGAGGEEKKD